MFHAPQSLSNASVLGHSVSKSLMFFMFAFFGVFSTSMVQAQYGSYSNQVVSAPPAAPVTISSHVQKGMYSPGEQGVIAIVLDHAEHYHSNLNQPIIPKELEGLSAIPTTIELPEIDGVSFEGIVWPEPVEVQVDFLMTGNSFGYLVYTGKAIVYVPFQVLDTAQLGEQTIDMKVSYQVCDDTTCFPPDSADVQVHFEIVAAGASDSSSESGISDPETQQLFEGYDPEQEVSEIDSDEPADAESAKIERKFLGLVTIPEPNSFVGIVVLALSSMLGGFILNLTPCVLPVIPIKVMTISSHAGESRARAFVLSMWMAIGVITFWGAIGIPVAFVSSFTDPSIIFGIWWITAIIGIVIILMSVGIMGLFQINLPQKVYMVNPKADSVQGSFVFGLMTAVLGLPCFGFVAGALLAGAATMPPSLVLTVFVFIGVGMALPYVVLAMSPKLMDKLPRTGPASELVKQVMGLLMLAAGAYFIGTSVISFGSGQSWSFPWWGKSVHWWAIGLVGLATGGWLIIQTIKITKRLKPRVMFGVLGLFFATTGSGMAYNQTMHQYHNFWEPFSVEYLESSLDSGKVVVLDFTAEWCLNCKALEATVLSRNPVKAQLLSTDVVPMVADLTSVSAPGWEHLNDTLGETGIPFLVVYAPGQDEPIWKSNSYTPGQVVDAIELARSEAAVISQAD